MMTTPSRQMTKTEQDVLTELTRRGRYTACVAYGHGGGGGWKRGGHRTWDAAVKLVQRGEAREIHRGHEVEYNHGFKMAYETLVIGLPE